MKILYYDCFSGISGDMNLAALLGLGVEPDFLRAELDKLALDDEFSLKITEDSRKGISGIRVDVVLKKHDHGHRNLRDIEAIIRKGTLDSQVQETSLAIFRRIAEAEAKVHGKSLDEVHFHEVGATDSIVDIVGAAICIHALNVDEIWCSPIELGGGFVDCAHGKLPVPAPATVELLTGCPTTRGAVDKETTTPTGAAILAEFTDKFTAMPAMTTTRTAYGIGHRDTAIPNVLRVQLAEVRESSLPASKPARLLQCNIDDMTGEQLGAVMETLFEERAMDVHFTPIIMKKSRPATTISVLCAEKDAERFMRLLFVHTTTLGIKSIPVEKTELERTFDTLETPLGSVTMKNALFGGTVIRSKPELDECVALAKKHGLPLRDVHALIEKTKKD